jgi:dihydroaeruginoic acid synthetase
MIEIGKKNSEIFPPPPQLPFQSSTATVTDKRYLIRREYEIGRDKWNKLQAFALAHGFSSLSVLLSAFGEVLGRWSSGSEMTVILLNDSSGHATPEDLFNRMASQPAIPVVFKPVRDENRIEICRRTELQLADSVNRCPATVSSIFPNIAKDSGQDDRQVVVVFSGVLPAFHDSAGTDENMVNNASGSVCDEHHPQEMRMPQVCLHCHVSEHDEEIGITWDVLAELFPLNLPDAMFEVYICLLNWSSEKAWAKQAPDFLPELQRAVREKVNATFVPVKEKLIHQEFFIHAQENPEKEALLWDENGIDRMMTYGELADKALRLAALLSEKGVQQGEAVAVTLPRGPNQVIAVLAVLAAGAVYVPIGVNQPAGRRDRIYRIGGISRLVTDKTEFAVLSTEEKLTVIMTDEADKVSPLPRPVSVNTDALAYVIFTSGSTGEPKGVQIPHRAAYNTILDINTRFSVSASDRVLAVSALDFDLSVYDLFGLLSAGGGIVLLNESTEREAPVWLELIRRMNVTVWNSVPALLDMLMIAAGEYGLLPSLRLALVSGDWVGLDLHDRLIKKSQDCRFIALGGATEASIWSNYFEVTSVDPSWSSIPYGAPLTNQCFRVVDRFGRDCPDMVTGELWIGGMGVARGYLGNSELTSKSFINTGENRWYRTGDLARYWSDGILEFLGRADQQVKLRGYRIELGEIEAVLRQYAGISQAVAVISSGTGTQHLVAAVVAGCAPVQVHTVSSVPSNSDSFRNSSREIQSKIAEALIAEILNLAELQNDTGKNLHPGRQLRITDENQSLLQMWLRWLGGRNVITDYDGVLHGGPRIEEVLQYAKTLQRSAVNSNGIIADDPLISSVARRLFQRLDDYRGILSGEISSVVLLDDDILSPESLSSRDSGTIAGIELIAEKIKCISKAAGKPVETALIGGRSGIIAAKLLDMLDPEDISFTLLDSALSMVETAKIHLSSLPHSVNCKRLPEYGVPDQLRYSFDLVLAVNALHRYHDPYQGVAIASLLVRCGGKILALEHCEITPLAAVTSAVLDRGFADFDHDRRQAYSPMLPAQQWANLFKKAGFNKTSFMPVGDSFTEFIEADCPATRPELDLDCILKFTADHLPPHMLPEKIEILPWLPLSANGKVDRAAVTAVFAFRAEERGGEKPHAGMEQEVAEMWQKLLSSGAIGRKQGFFEIGGDSLLATRFLAGVKEKFGVELSLRQMFELPALFQVASVLESKLMEMKQTMESMEEGEI